MFSMVHSYAVAFVGSVGEDKTLVIEGLDVNSRLKLLVVCKISHCLKMFTKCTPKKRNSCLVVTTFHSLLYTSANLSVAAYS